MQFQPYHNGADVLKVFEQGGSGRPPAPWLTPDQLLELSLLCRTGGKLICNAEAYAITEEHDTPRIDLAIYLGGSDQQAKSWADRVAASHAEVAVVVDLARKEADPIRFQVWLDWPEEPPIPA